MNKEELKSYLKENLKINVHHGQFSIEAKKYCIQLQVEDEVIDECHISMRYDEFGE